MLRRPGDVARRAMRRHCAFMRLGARPRLAVVLAACYNPASFVIAAQERGV